MSGALWNYIVRRTAPVAFLLGLVPLIIGSVLGFLWPIIEESRGTILELLESFQRFLPADARELTSPAGQFGLPFLHPLSLVAFALGGGLGPLSLPAGERGRGGLDLLLATGLSRAALVRTVALTLPVPAILLAAMPWLGARVGGALAEMDSLPWLAYGACAVQAFALVFFFGCAALFLATLAPHGRRAWTLYGSFVGAALLLELASRTAETLHWIGRFGPYGWYEVSDLVFGRTEGPLRGLGVLLGASLLLLALSELCARRRRQA